MRKILFVILLFVASVCQAKFDALVIADVIDQAKIIGVGKIIGINENTITVELSDVLKGTSQVKTITIQKFRDWECAERWRPYALGDRELFFLKPDGDSYKIIGRGDEGEMPVFNANVYYKTPSLTYLDGSVHYKLGKHGFSGHKFSLAEVKAGIVVYLGHREDYRSKSSVQKITPHNRFLALLVAELRHK